MEMTVKRWVAMSVFTCALIGIGTLARPEREARTWRRRTLTPEEEAVTQLRTESRNLQFQLQMAERREAFLADLAGRQLANSASAVFAQDGFPASVRAILEEELTEFSGELSNGPNDPRIIVEARFRDSPGSYAHVSQLLPPAVDGHTCLVSFEVPAGDWTGLDPRAALQQWLNPYGDSPAAVSRGPCGFYAAFGHPGRPMAEWLRSWNHAFDMVADWDLPPADVRPRLVDEGFGPLPERFGFSAGTQSGLDALACASDRPTRCTELLFGGEAYRASYQRRRAEIVPGYVIRARWVIFGPHTAYLLSDLAREIGRERFRQLWSSELPVDEAFASVVGTEIGAWTAGWLAERVGVKHYGPTVGAPLTLAMVLMGVIATGVGVTIAQRRKGGAR
jgi:hypothetical protein